MIEFCFHIRIFSDFYSKKIAGKTKSNKYFAIKLTFQSNKERGFVVSQETPIVPSDYEVVYIIAKKNANAKSLPYIPFFSKVSYRNAAKRLQRYGYKVSITAVPYTYIAADIQENE